MPHWLSKARIFRPCPRGTVRWFTIGYLVAGWQLDMRPALEWFDGAPWKMPLEDWRFEIRLPIM